MPRAASILIALSALAGLAFSADSAAAQTVGPNACDSGGMLSRIQHRFRYQVNHVPHLPNVSIVEFERIHEVRHIPRSEDKPIARRYCAATALLSDGTKREVWYLIEGRMGFAGMGNNVEFCVDGFDRWYVYNGACRVLR